MSRADGEFRDGLVDGPARGRGAGLNPGNRFEGVRLHVLGEHLDEIAAERPDGTRVVTRVFADRSKTVLNRVESPDLPMEWSLNPYRGCEHGCVYCYARPGHEYLGLSCGLDFESKILAKPDAPALLRAAILKPSWTGETISMSGVTDCYQPIESKLRITRGCLEVCAEMAQPVTIVTKNRLVTRDADLLKDLARHRATAVAISLTTLDNRLAASMEPRASSPRERLGAMRTLADAGVPVMVMTAPIIPGLNDRELPALLRAAADAGAQEAGLVMLRLPYQIKDVFLEWLAREHPDRAARVEANIRDVRGGGLNDPRFSSRMRGEGPLAEQIRRLFEVSKRRCGLGRTGWRLSNAEFLRRRVERATGGQLGLFA